jgi:hypothetical protein
LDNHELAWAAGFFDAEGWANRKKRGVQARINQAGLDGVPEVLLKFQRIVGVGRIRGPALKKGRQPLYWWEATSRPDLTQVVERIGPWLCPAKRAQFERTLGYPLPPAAWSGSMSEELAWAGGFFDGEGSTCLDKHRTHVGYFVPVMYVPQAATDGIAPELLRFQSALGLGRISGVRRADPPQKPYRRWRLYTVVKVQLALHLLWPWIGIIKQSQALRAMRVVHAQPDLARGNPAFGTAGARYCLRGHDKWNARVRPFKGRGVNVDDPQNHFRQCLQCVRDDARERRKRKRKRRD